MKNVEFYEQSRPFPEGFEHAVKTLAASTFPRASTVGLDKLGDFMVRKTMDLQARFNKTVHDCFVSAEIFEIEMVFYVDAPERDTGFATITLSIDIFDEHHVSVGEFK